MIHQAYSRFRSFFAIGLTIVIGWSGTATAEGWESIELPDLVQRSRLIGVGTLRTHGKAEDGWQRGKIYFTEQLYSAVGDQDSYEVRVATETIPGERQHWASGKKGIWFILAADDRYEPINHPSCWMDEDEAKKVADQAYATANQVYEEAKQALEESSSDEEGDEDESDSDDSDSDESVEAYEAMTTAAAAGSRVPFQDQAMQSQRFFNQVTSMLNRAGIQLPFPTDLSSPANQQRFFDQARQLLGPAGSSFGSLAPQGDPARAGQLSAMQNNMANVLNSLTRNTLGSQNPAQALSQMQAIPLEMPGASGGGGPLFQSPQGAIQGLPTGGSRKQMLGSLLNPAGNLPKPPNKPRFPGGGGPKGPGGGPKGPGPR